MCYTWYPEAAPGVGTTLIQVGQAQCRLNKGVTPCPTAKQRLCWEFDWSTGILIDLFSTSIFSISKSCLFKNGSALQICVYLLMTNRWGQLIAVQCSQLLLELCKSHVEIHAQPSSRPGFEPALCYSSSKFPNCLHFLQSSNLEFFSQKELYLPSLSCKGLGCPTVQAPVWKLVLLQPNGCLYGQRGSKK